MTALRCCSLVVISLVLLSFSTYSNSLAADKCFECHKNLGDKPSALFKKDVHHLKGISCASCHGGDPSSDDMEKAMNKKGSFVGVLKGDAISKACAQCHADKEKMKSYGSSLPTNQWELLQQSVHGAMSVSGKEHLVQCTTCHNAHGIVSIKNPSSPAYALNIVKTCAQCHSSATFMRAYNPSLPIDQLEKYRTSVHGVKNAQGDPKAAECANCHGSHGIFSSKNPKSRTFPTNIPSTCGGCHSNAEYMKPYGIATDQLEQFTKSVHGVALLEKRDLGAPGCNSCHGNHGATPPGVQSISNVCGTCHALNAELFSSSPHKKAFDELGVPECETCHGNHQILIATNELLGTDSDAMCSRCHSETENSKGFHSAKAMRQLIDSLEHAEDAAKLLVEDAEQKGMEISEAKFKLRDARQARLETRTVVHAFNQDKFRETAHKGLLTTSAVHSEAKQAINEYYFRRFGLGIATLIITILALSLYLYIKRIEGQSKTSKTQ